ncbi:unnamed protein product [Moneuplotes crassus]|uniref:EF-hand domain-containing protein n=1 Tax=Euplotes crassus TaxID=5936 RepID=A0AAD1U7G7_EUPCR|nr:unnamed protein product [Moneuplotes crassus]
MSSLIKEAENLRKGLVSDMDRSMYNDEKDLFINSHDPDHQHNESEPEACLELKTRNKRKRSASSSRRYRKASKKNKFKIKDIDTDFQLNRNDLFNNNPSSNGAVNQTLQIFASSGIGSPAAGSMHPGSFKIGRSTKNNLATGTKRPVSAVMSHMNSPNSSMDLPMFDLNRMRPRIIKKDKKSLYDNVMKLKLAHNSKMSENTKLKTNIYKLEAENSRKDKILEEILQTSSGATQVGRIKAESHLNSGMKRHIKELKQELEVKELEIKRLKKNIRLTQFQELETEIQTYIKECERLRRLAKGVISSKDPLFDNQTRHELEQRFHEQTMIMERLRGENRNLEQLLHEKEMEIIHLKDLSPDHRERSKSNKRDRSVKEKRKYERQIKSKNQEINKLKSEILSLKKNLNNYKTTCMTPEQLKSEREKDRLKMSDVLRQRTALESELNKLKADKFSQNRQANTTRNEIEELQQQLKEQKDKNESQQKEIERFKTLYINEKSLTGHHFDSKEGIVTDAAQAVKPFDNSMQSQEVPQNDGANTTIQKPEEAKEENILKSNKKAPIQGIIPVAVGGPKSSPKLEESKKTREPFQRAKSPDPVEEPSKENSVRLLQEEESKMTPKANNKILETPVQRRRKNSDSSTNEFKEENAKKDESTDSDINNLASNYVRNTIKQHGERSTEERKISPKKKDRSSHQPEIDIQIESVSKKEDQADPTEDDEIADEEMQNRKHRLSSNVDGTKMDETNMNELTDNRSDSSEDVELEDPRSSNLNVFKSRVSIVDIPQFVKIEFKLILQNKKIPYEKIKKLFPPTKRISLQQLKDHLLQLGRFEEPVIIEQICRYLVENDANGDMIAYNNEADMDKIAIVSKFKNKVVTEDYTIFDEDTPIKKAQIEEIKEEILKLLSSDMEAFKSALDIEDVKENGCLSYEQFRGVLRNMDTKFKKIHLEYMVYEMYKVSQNSRKLNYKHLLDLLCGNKEESMNRYGDLEDDSYFSHSVTKSAVQKRNLKSDEEAKNVNENTDTQINEDNETENNNQEQEESGMNNADLAEGEEYINDEEMIRISESCLIRISNELKIQNISIHELFKDDIIVQEYENQEIELLTPEGFIEGIHQLGIEDFTELDVACLINLLSRPELEDLILIEELEILKDTDKLKSLIDEMLEKNAFSQDQTSEGREEQQENPPNGKAQKKNFNLDSAGDRSICVIYLLIDFLIRNDLSTYTYFGNKIYQQLVKSKSKESTVELIAAKDFFDVLQQEVVTEEFLETIDDSKPLLKEGDAYQTVKEDLMDILSIDANYKDLIFMKKLTKFIEEVSQNDNLKERALNYISNTEESAEETSLRSALNQFQAPLADNRRNLENGGLNPAAERLNTIEEEEKQYETVSHINKTQDRNTGLNTSNFKPSSPSTQNYQNSYSREGIEDFG